jgi:hypothetical protein
MPTSDLQLQRLGLKPMSHLPNRDGFRFTGVKRDGSDVACWVLRNPQTGLHVVSGSDFADLIGWKQ